MKKFIELSEQKVTDAQAKSDEVQTAQESSTATQSIDDLEASETPESILLSTVSGEQSKDRTDRAIVTPWLKFLWETYRTVLDILKNNARLEILYQTTAHQAFSFCQRYTRKTEFRRLCELLRNHLQNAAKYQSQPHSINLSDPDTLQRHLDTRFQQLNVAVELELWQEAFRSVEDIHTLLNLSKRPAKPIMMANYFDKLATIFLVSDNYLFHAAAYNRYFNLLRSSAAAVAAGQASKKDSPAVTEADITKNASFVILAALSIPVISTSRSRGALADVDEARKNKHQRLTNLLGMSQAPTRAALFKEIQARGLLKRARPEIRDLYNILEVDFHPLSICKKISPILAQIGSDPELGKYVMPLQQVILTRLFQQLSQVYESVELKYVMGLAQFPEPFQVTGSMIEKFIMNGCKKGDLAIRIDHATGVLTFDNDVFSAAKALHPGSGAGSAETEVTAVQRLQITPAEIVRSQLTRLAKTLYVTCQYVDTSFVEEQRKSRAAALERAESGMEQEHSAILERRATIERRKQTAASAAAQKAKEEETRKRMKVQEAQAAETERRKRDELEREQRRQKEELRKVQQAELIQQLDELKKSDAKVDLSGVDIEDLDSAKIRILKIQALEKEKNKVSEQLRITAKRIDHLERAFRQEEIKHLPEDFEKQRKRDLEEYEKTKEETLRDAEQKHKDDVALKNRLSRLVTSYEDFTKMVRGSRTADFEKRRKTAEREYEEKKQARIREHRARKQQEREQAAARERAEREEQERLEREAADKAAAEEEKRAKMAEEKARRDEDRRLAHCYQHSRLYHIANSENRKGQEAAQKQAQREEEALARRAAEKKAGSRPVERPSEPSPAGERPKLNLAPRNTAAAGGDGGGGWREREAAKLAAQANDVPAQAPAPGAAPEPDAPVTGRTGSGYITPALRAGRGGADTPRTETPRSEVPRSETPRGESAADGAPPAVDRWRSAGARPGPRDENAPRYSSGRVPQRGAFADSTSSSADGAKDGRSFSGRADGPPARTDSPAQTAGSGGRYVPGAFRKARGDGQ